MYVPNPLGRYPLVLREHGREDTKNGELLLDYSNCNIYYINYETGEEIAISEDIYKKIIEARAENTKIEVKDEEYPVSSRECNKFYFMITDVEEI